MTMQKDLTGNTIFNNLDDQGEPLMEGESYALYPPPEELPYIGPLTADDAVQLAGVIAWYEWDDEAGLLVFADTFGERMDLGNFLYAKRQS